MCHVVAKTFSAAGFFIKNTHQKRSHQKNVDAPKIRLVNSYHPHRVLTSFWRKPFNGEWGDFSDVVLVQHSERTPGKGQNITTSEEPPDLIGKSLLNNTHLMVLTFRGINAHILGKFFYFCENCSAAKFVWKASNPIFQFGFGQLNWRGKHSDLYFGIFYLAFHRRYWVGCILGYIYFCTMP